MDNLARILSLFVVAMLSLAAAAPASADSTARIIGTQPAAEAALGHQESFWVRIEYSSDEPMSLWARPYLNGVQVKKAFTNASWDYSGSGEALGWFALTEAGEVDEVRIFSGGGKPYRERELARQAVRLSWTNDIAAAVPQPAWVTELLAAEKERQAEQVQRRASEPTSVKDAVFLNGFMLLVMALFVASIGVPLWSVWRWQGGWRIAAAVPATLVLFVVLRIIIGVTHDPTSHNLWPFEILEFGILALVMIAVLALAQRFLATRSQA